MLKHVQISPMRSRSRSTSTSCSSSLCGSPEPPTSEQQRSSSRSSSYSSLNESVPQTTLKIYTGCLHQDIEYKTLIISWDTTCQDIVGQVLRRCKMRHRDPKLFYLTMEVTIRPSAVQTTMVLDAEARPALLQACHPKGDSRFYLQIKTGGLVRVRTSVLQPMSQYKSLMISEATTCDELLALLLSCFNLNEKVEQFFLYEVCPNQEYQRKLHPDDLPLLVQTKRHQRGDVCHFLVRRNPNYLQHNQLLPSISEKSCFQLTKSTPINQINLSTVSLPVMAVTGSRRRATICSSSMKKPTNLSSTVVDHIIPAPRSVCPTYENINVKESLRAARKSLLISFENTNNRPQCTQCRNSFKLCDCCDKVKTNNDNLHRQQQQLHNKINVVVDNRQGIVETYNHNHLLHNQRHNNSVAEHGRTLSSSYNPVYNVREIRTSAHSFSAFGVDKKFMNIEHFEQIYAFDFINGNETLKNRNKKGNGTSSLCGSRRNSLVIAEAVNTNPKQGVGNFVYI